MFLFSLLYCSYEFKEMVNFSDGGEIEEEKAQGCAYKDRFSYTYEGHLQQVKSLHIANVSWYGVLCCEMSVILKSRNFVQSEISFPFRFTSLWYHMIRHWLDSLDSLDPCANIYSRRLRAWITLTLHCLLPFGHLRLTTLRLTLSSLYGRRMWSVLATSASLLQAAILVIFSSIGYHLASQNDLT